MERIISVAIDGPSGAGKSTIARAAAKRFGLIYVDTGAIYRTVAHAVHLAGKECTDGDAVRALLPTIRISMRYDEQGVQRMLLGGEDVSEAIRLPENSKRTSQVSAMPEVRDFLMDMQRNLAATHSVVMDGRDIGTVVFPHAELKVFVTASAQVRAQRRYDELQQKGMPADYDEILRNVQERDYIDSHREVSPLRQADDALLLDNSHMTIPEQNEWLMQRFLERTA